MAKNRLGQAINTGRKRHENGMNKIIEVSLDQIEEVSNVRDDYNGIKELSDSIKENGLINPITVTETAAGKYRVITGHRRTRAARAAGEKAIKAIVSDIPEADILPLQLIENIQRDDLTPIELENAVFELCQTMKQSKAAQVIGKGKAYVSHILKAYELRKKCSRLHFSEYTSTTVYELSRAKEQEEAVKQFLDLPETERTQSKARAIAESIKQKDEAPELSDTLKGSSNNGHIEPPASTVEANHLDKAKEATVGQKTRPGLLFTIDGEIIKATGDGHPEKPVLHFNDEFPSDLELKERVLETVRRYYGQ